MTTPIPTPGPYPTTIPDPGVRPVPAPSPQPAPKPAPTTGAKPGILDKALDAITPEIPGLGVVSDVSDGITAVRAWISNRHNWIRVAWFFAGSAMFTVGALMVGERPLANATNAVVQPVGKVVKSAYKG